VKPIDPALVELARDAGLVVTVEDGVVDGGVGARLAQTLRAAGLDVPAREIGVPVRFLTHGKVKDVQASVGLTVLDIGRRIVEWSALTHGSDDHEGDRLDEEQATSERPPAGGPAGAIADESRQRGE
jgi:1-deoxy-D-xylulose-5-phosphate synthase